MRTFLTTLFTRGKGRAILSALYLVVLIMNVGVMVDRLVRGNDGWIVNLVVVAGFCLVLWMNYTRFRREDRDAEVPEPITEAIPVVPSSEATDPRMYAMMRAWETGEPMSVHLDDDGVWRDSATGEALPDHAQGK